MSVSKTYSAQSDVLTASIVSVEIDLSKGLYAFAIVGLASKAVDEAKDRISAAIKNSGWKSPKQNNQKIVISLAPADVKKDGTGFDLAMAVGYLAATDDIRFDPEGKIFIGELSLEGILRPVKGILPMILTAQKHGFREAFVPKENMQEAALVEGIAIYPAENLAEVVKHINERNPKDTEQKKNKIIKAPRTVIKRKTFEPEVDLSDIAGQFAAKRALEIALAGGHNLLLFGPPGTGKTMLAKAAAALLPDLSFDDMLTVTSIYSMYGVRGLVTEAPFRAPHHTASYVSIIGGGTTPKPGEVTLAHKGILFLDELPEFDSPVLESLREPLEEGTVRISRARGSATYPANFTLIGAMNPCPCGNFGLTQSTGRECRCSALQIERYKRRMSGPIMDRIDLFVEVSKVDHEKLTGKNYGEKSLAVKKRILDARVRQENRGTLNSELSAKHIAAMDIAPECKKILNDSAKRLDLSARAYHRLIKTARTIADLAGKKDIYPEHILEALQYRPKLYN